MKRAFIQLHAAIFLAGFTGILGRLISLGELWLVWYRLLMTSAILWLMHVFQKRQTPLNSKDWWALVGVGSIAALHWVTFYGSIKTSNVSIALVCFSSVGFFTALLEPIILATRFKISEILLGLLVIGGILFIFQFDPQYKEGILIGVLSAILGSIFPILNRKLLSRIPVSTLTRMELTGGLLFLSVLLPLYMHFYPNQPFFPTGSDWLWLFLLSAFCTVLAFQLSMRALRHISAFTVNLSYNLEPVYGIALAFVVFHENRYLGPGFYGGLLLIITAVVLQMLNISRPKGRPNP